MGDFIPASVQVRSMRPHGEGDQAVHGDMLRLLLGQNSLKCDRDVPFELKDCKPSMNDKLFEFIFVAKESLALVKFDRERKEDYGVIHYSRDEKNTMVPEYRNLTAGEAFHLYVHLA